MMNLRRSSKHGAHQLIAPDLINQNCSYVKRQKVKSIINHLKKQLDKMNLLTLSAGKQIMSEDLSPGLSHNTLVTL